MKANIIAENDEVDPYDQTWKAGQIFVNENKQDREKYG